MITTKAVAILYHTLDGRERYFCSDCDKDIGLDVRQILKFKSSFECPHCYSLIDKVNGI